MRLSCVLLLSTLSIGGIAFAGRPPTWAVPIARPGLPNLHRVSEVYYRGALPSAAGMRQLATMGIKTVVNLRAGRSDALLVAGTTLATEHIRFKTWHPEREDVVRFLDIVTDPKRQPVFVHCQFGADRTGMMTAIYRIVVEGWSKEEAIAEMRDGGFGFHPTWKKLIVFIRDLDVSGLHAAR